LVENTNIPTLLFENSSYNRLQLFGKSITKHEGDSSKTSYITLTQDELNSFHYVKGDTEGIVNYGLSIKGIHFTAIFIENKDEISSKYLSAGWF
jgi:phosphoesterase RecJ-like protein